MKSRNGFTIVEIMVTVAIIATLATIVTLSFNRQLVETRDSARATNATLLAASLEKYYDEHGEYPSPRALASTYAGNTGDAVATILSVKDKSTLLMPNATASTTNSIAAALGTDDVLAYVATSGVGNENCQTNTTAGCDEFTLSYKKESDNSIVIIQSTYKGRPGDYQSPLKPSDKPTLAATQSGTNIIATSAIFACPAESGLTPSYSFRERIAAGSWLAWGNWQSGNTYTRGSNTNATAYSFQVQGRCASATNVGEISPTSDPVSVTYYLMPAAPSVPTLNATVSGTNVIGTSSIVTCNYGNDEYRIDSRTNSGTWSTNLWGAGNTASLAGSNAVTYGFMPTARCVNGTQTATSVAGLEDTVVYYAMPATPAAPTMNATTSGANVTGTASTVTCNYGNDEYLIDYRTNSGAWNVGTWGTGMSRTIAGSNGVNYGFRATSRCVNSTQIATSGVGAEDTVLYYAMPTTPGTPTINGALSGATVVGTSTTVACNYGSAQYLIDYSINDGTWSIGAWGSATTRATTAYDGYKYEFRSTARCVNSTQIATTGTSAEDIYVDPITTPGAPTVSGATYTGKNWTWSGTACPAGTWATYQYAFLTYSGSWVGSAWVNAGTGTNVTNPAATSQGLSYTVAVHQNCVSNYTSSGWSGDTWGASFYVPVVHKQAQYVGYRIVTISSVAYPSMIVKSYTGSCAAGLTMYVGAKIDYGNSGTYTYYSGTVADPFVPAYAGLVFTNSARAAAVDQMVEISARVQCRNEATAGTHDANDDVSLDMLYNTGNLYNRGSSKYNISCANPNTSSYCAVGYNLSGTSGTTDTAAKACNVKSSTNSFLTNSSTYHSALTAFNTASVCWSA